MKKVKIIKCYQVSPTRCRVNREGRLAIKECFLYDKTYWKRQPGKRRKEETIKDQYLITGHDKTGGSFWSGSFKRCQEVLAKRKIKLVLKVPQKLIDIVEVERPPKLAGVTFRPDQLKAIDSTGDNYFGRILAPTRSGKSFVQLGIASQFPSANILLLAHTKDLVDQLARGAYKYSANLPRLIFPKGARSIEKHLASMPTNPAFMICTIQSMSRVPPEKYGHIFDIVMIDEAHRVNKVKSMYGNFLTQSVIPRRYGFTATLPTTPEQELINEGLLGPIIAELTYGEAIEKGIIANPMVITKSVPYDNKINASCRSYQDYYDNAIIKNEYRNLIITDIVRESHEKNLPTLVIVERIEHGKLLKKTIRRKLGIRVPFVKGSTDDDMRGSRLNRIIEGKELITICSRIWMEGMTMQNLLVVVYAAAMKEKKRILQAMGRGLGVTASKSKVTLYDFLDPYRYLAEHSIIRFQTYLEEGWIKWTS